MKRELREPPGVIEKLLVELRPEELVDDVVDLDRILFE